MKKLTISLLIATIMIFSLTACNKLSLPKDMQNTSEQVISAYKEEVLKSPLSELSLSSYFALALNGQIKEDKLVDITTLELTSAGAIAKATILYYSLGKTVPDSLIKTMLDSTDNDGNGWNLLVPAYSLIALTVSKSTIAGEYNKDKLIDTLLEKQQENGGFSNSEFIDIDSTAMILQALAMHTDIPKVKTATDKTISFLSNKQDNSGGFVSTDNPDWMPEINACSTAQVLIAVISCKIDPFKDSRFIKENKTMYDFLLTLKRDDNFIGNSPSTKDNDALIAYATEQTVMAFGSVIKYNKTGKTIYEFK